jgi:hypothetical protein
MPDVTQALVAVGGSGNRIRADGLDVPLSKSFLPIAGTEVLYWVVSGLLEAGISSLIFTADRGELFPAVRKVLSRLPAAEEVIFFEDDGLGTHGLPYQVLRGCPRLQHNFLFECGNSVMTPDHYRSLCRAKTPTNVIFSAFDPHPVNLRQPVGLDPCGRVVRPLDTDDRGAIAHPMVIDREYADALPDLDFDINQIIDNYIQRDMLYYVKTSLRPEFDYLAEYQDCIAQFERLSPF